jgi:hypothetical protein
MLAQQDLAYISAQQLAGPLFLRLFVESKEEKGGRGTEWRRGRGVEESVFTIHGCTMHPGNL